MVQVFQSVALCSGVGGVLALALLLLSPLTKRGLGARGQCCIWVCALAVMVLPVRFSLPARPEAGPAQIQAETVGEGPAGAGPAAQDAQAPQTAVDQRMQPRQATPGEKLAPYGLAVLAGIWGLGLAVSLGGALARYAWFLRVVGRSARAVPCPELEEVKAGLGLRRRVRVRVAGCTAAPLAVGVLRPAVLLPEREMEPGQLRHILAHELTHIKRRDLLLKWFALLVRCVHWFNPLVYLLCRRMEEDCEIACDLAVTGGMDVGERRGYMRTILSLAMPAPEQVPELSTTMAGGREQLERRFTMIQTAKQSSRPAALLSAALVLALLSTSVLASGLAAGAVGQIDQSGAVVEVYDGKTLLRLANRPFIQDYEVYLPLRETLAAFGIGDVKWSDGKIDIVLPPVEDYRGSIPQEPSCRLEIGAANIRFPDSKRTSYRNGVLDTSPDAVSVPLRCPPVVRDGVSYATVQFFECLSGNGQMPGFRVYLRQSADPGDYYGPGEEVFIGTGEEQDAYRPVDEHGNPRYVKRIVTDDAGKAVFVVPAEYQKPEVIAGISAVNSASMEGFRSESVTTRTFYYNAYGEGVLLSSGIFVEERVGENDFARIAYIPPALQINCFAYHAYEFGT